ncbi:MAG TPA: aldehyde dehydrogenase family protein, partial [Parvularculaceae bacterium]|nr:aldehyde dehydrogenase family protein [Parvularculaceae bacterium]
MTDTVFINGVWRKGRGATFTSVDPSTGAVIFQGDAATKDDVAEAVSAARAAFPGWAMTPLEKRIEIMARYRDIIQRDGEALARLISEETGKPFWETKTEAASVAGKV